MGDTHIQYILGTYCVQRRWQNAEGAPIEYNMTESEGQDPRTPAAYWIRREWEARVQDGRSVEKLEVGVCAGGEGRTSAGPIAI